MGSTMKGRLFVISAPSGAGKTSISNRIVREVSGIRFSVSYTTRAIRPGETHGQHYYYVSAKDFQDMADRGEFLEHAVVHGNRYGTHRAQVQTLLDQGMDVLCDIDVQGADYVRAHFTDPVSIFVLAPNLGVLAERLNARGTEREEIIRTRLDNARHEVERGREYNYIVVNDNLEDAILRVRRIIEEERDRRRRNHDLIDRFLSGERVSNQ
ncbi:MAG: Guanylate kinase [Myxococcota bacterium]|nr:Guanylate kinase [Myxococcota bacterium]